MMCGGRGILTLFYNKHIGTQYSIFFVSPVSFTARDPLFQK